MGGLVPPQRLRRARPQIAYRYKVSLRSALALELEQFAPLLPGGPAVADQAVREPALQPLAIAALQALWRFPVELLGRRRGGS
jgi:hypothetical protein